MRHGQGAAKTEIYDRILVTQINISFLLKIPADWVINKKKNEALQHSSVQHIYPVTESRGRETVK